MLLYGSLRERSYSRLLTFEAQRLLDAMGAETRIFHANGLPLPGDVPYTHPKVQELREAMLFLGRWMRMVTIPNQSSVAKAWQEFTPEGRMKPSSYYERVVDVMEELMKFTLLTRGIAGHHTDRYSERRETAAKLEERTKLASI